MIYTLGQRSIYEPLIANPKGQPFKDVGGSVWRTRRDAERYRSDMGLSETFAVYGVLGSWDHDTRGPMRGCRWRELERPCPLVCLPAPPPAS